MQRALILEEELPHEAARVPRNLNDDNVCAPVQRKRLVTVVAEKRFVAPAVQAILAINIACDLEDHRKCLCTRGIISPS